MGKEWVACAAIYVDDGVEYPQRTYVQPKVGLVFCQRRHADCLVIVYAFYAHLGEEVAKTRCRAGVQGFLTSTGRFVDRKEAAVLAVEAGQVQAEDIRGDRLYSEELY